MKEGIWESRVERKGEAVKDRGGDMCCVAVDVPKVKEKSTAGGICIVKNETEREEREERRAKIKGIKEKRNKRNE